MSDYVIEVKNVDKVYKLYDSNKARVADTLGLARKKNYKEHYEGILIISEKRTNTAEEDKSFLLLLFLFRILKIL